MSQVLEELKPIIELLKKQIHDEKMGLRCKVKSSIKESIKDKYSDGEKCNQ